eukprot:365187-Chlamydomonas_euryale.AAC.8
MPSDAAFGPRPTQERQDRGAQERQDRGAQERQDRGAQERRDRGAQERQDRGAPFTCPPLPCAHLPAPMELITRPPARLAAHIRVFFGAMLSGIRQGHRQA